MSALRVGLAAGAVALLGFFAIVLFRVDQRLDSQAGANRTTLRATAAIVSVNGRIAERLGQLDALTREAGAALDSTQSLTDLVDQLRVATSEVNSLTRQGRGGAEATRASLERIRRLVDALSTQVGDLGRSSEGLVAQQGAVAGVLKGVAGDLDSALAEARRIRRFVDSLVPG